MTTFNINSIYRLTESTKTSPIYEVLGNKWFMVVSKRCKTESVDKIVVIDGEMYEAGRGVFGDYLNLLDQEDMLKAEQLTLAANK